MRDVAAISDAPYRMASPVMAETTILPPCSATVEGSLRRPPAYTVAWTLLILTLLAPPMAFGAVQEWAWGTIAVVAFLLLLWWSIDNVRQRSMMIFWSPLCLPAGLFLLLAMVQFARPLTMDPIATREAVLKLSTSLILFFLTGQVFGAPAFARTPLGEGVRRTKTRPRARGGVSLLSTSAVRWTIVVYAFLLALFAIFQFFSSPGLIYWTVISPGWTFGPYVNHNHYAGLMEMLIPLSVASVLPAVRKPSSSVLLGFVVSIPVASLLLSGSRGGFISLMVEVVLAAVLIFWCGPRPARRVAALVGGATILAAALMFFWMAPSDIAQRLATMGDGTHPREVELGNRLEASRDSLRILRDHPWLGAGLGSFETVFPRYQSFASDLRWDHAHNDYVEALAETGLAGGAVLLCALGLFFRLAFRNLREKLQDPAGWMPFAAALGCCGLLVHSFADFNLHIPANAAWFAVCAAMATSSTEVVVWKAFEL
jgi:O-antigen ligase